MANLSSYSFVLSDSETETTNTDFTRTKKQQRQTISTRKNRSHTTFFFRIDDNDPNLAYCKICEINFAETNKTVRGYVRKGGNTTNLIAHLRDKHKITKDNYLEFLDEHEEVF